MPSAKYRFTPLASKEVDEALTWYAEINLSVAESLLAELERGIQFVTERPTLWPSYEQGTRRYVLSKFPYSLIYRTAGDEVEIIAFAHQSRRPGYWRNR